MGETGAKFSITAVEKLDDTLFTKVIKKRPQRVDLLLADAAGLAHPSGKRLPGHTDPNTSRERPQAKKRKRYEQPFSHTCVRCRFISWLRRRAARRGRRL